MIAKLHVCMFYAYRTQGFGYDHNEMNGGGENNPTKTKTKTREDITCDEKHNTGTDIGIVEIFAQQRIEQVMIIEEEVMIVNLRDA